jgi:16S rRNA (adenine1518-N6/adenine1519-N6)-dimethyltransferase
MAHQFKKQFGQNFLRNDRFAQKLVDALDLNDQDTLVEIGPGDGRVTNLLLQKAGKVISVEIDYSLLPNLIKRFSDTAKFELLHSDVMELDLNAAPFTGKYKVAGSLPYNISKQIIQKFLTAPLPPEVMSFIVQEEVAQEYVATSPKATFLSNWIALYADVRKLESIPATQFFPKPKVNGGILVIKPAVKFANADQIAQVVRIGFAAPRKTLRNNIASGFKLEASTLDQIWNDLHFSPTIRPAELTLEQWEQLTSKISV